jgi:hypothetical protein
MTGRREDRLHALIALCVLAIAIASGPLFRYLPSPGSTLAWKASWLLLAFAALRLAHRGGTVAVLRELGLTGSAAWGMGFALVASIPMLATFAVTSSVNPHFAAVPLLMTGVVSPVSEELLFRGYVFLQLYRRAGWSFAAAIATTAAVFGLAHVVGLAGRLSILPLLGAVGMIALGGAFFAWLLVQWRDNLWVPIGLHACMNVWCYAFACDDAPGTLPTNAGRVLTAVAAIALTLAWRRWLAAHIVEPKRPLK